MTLRLALMRPPRRSLIWGGPLAVVAPPPLLLPPVLTASDEVTDRVWTLTASATGAAPITLSLAFTVNGSAVTPTLVSPGVWTYTAPSSLTDTVLAWTLTATNADGSDEASGGRTIEADLTPPPPAWVIDNSIILASPAVAAPTTSGAIITG